MKQETIVENNPTQRKNHQSEQNAEYTDAIDNKEDSFSDVQLRWSSKDYTPSIHTQNNCSNTRQGNKFMADDRGYVCPRRYWDVQSGCCNISPNGESWRRFYCDECDQESKCCQKYEFCVSCCLSKENYGMLKEVVTSLSPSDRLSMNNDFDLCKYMCRTNSKTVLHENAYRSKFKHCYGKEPPPLLPS